MYLNTLLVLLGFAAVFTATGVLRKHYTMFLLASGFLVIGGVMLTTAPLQLHTGWQQTGNVTTENLSTTETVDTYDLDRTKTYTSIDTQYDWPVPASDATGIMLLVAAAYLALAGVMQPEFMW